MLQHQTKNLLVNNPSEVGLWLVENIKQLCAFRVRYVQMKLQAGSPAIIQIAGSDNLFVNSRKFSGITNNNNCFVNFQRSSVIASFPAHTGNASGFLMAGGTSWVFSTKLAWTYLSDPENINSYDLWLTTDGGTSLNTVPGDVISICMEIKNLNE